MIHYLTIPVKLYLPGKYKECFCILLFGAGIVGSSLAHTLCEYDLKIALIDRNPQAGFGVSKASLSYIHLNHFNRPGSLRARLCTSPHSWYRKKAEHLGIPYGETDEIMIALNKRHIGEITTRKEWAEKNGEKSFRFMNPDEVARMEPNVTREILAAVHSRKHGMVYPPEWAFGLVDHARQNGVKTFFSCNVIGIEEDGTGGFFLNTAAGGENEPGWPDRICGKLRADYVVNAAGLHAARIAAMAGDSHIQLKLQRGSFAIFDKSAAQHVSGIVYVGGLDPGYSQVLGPTVHGNMILGMGHFVPPKDIGDTEVTKKTLEEVLRMGYQISPNLPAGDIITFFSGIKSTNNVSADGDFYIDYSERNRHFIHAVIGSPGVTAAPGIAQYILGLLADEDLPLRKKPDYRPYREVLPDLNNLDPAKRMKLIEKNPAFGHVVCRCEQVTEAQIEDAITRGAHTLDGIKHVTRAGMGRCQGSFCSAWIIQRLGEYHRKFGGRVSKRGKGSELICDTLESGRGNPSSEA